MTLQRLVRSYRHVIDEYIKSRSGAATRQNDRERTLWVRNDEHLYRWARRMGVKL